VNDLIAISKKDGVETVSARDLKSFLGLSERFSRWFDRMVGYGFVEGEDFTPYQTVHPLNNGVIDDYALTLDMGKELSMIARSDKGKQARRYFIEVEKRAREISKPLLPESYSDALFLAAKQAKEIEEKNKIIVEQTPKAEFYDMVAKSDEWMTLKQVSDVLNIPEYGRNNLCKRLRDEGFLTKYNQPYQKYKNQGLFKSIESVSKTGRISFSTVVSQKGLIKIRMVLLNPKSRNTAAYRKWKKEVFEKDLYTCQRCGYSGKDVEPHHIIPWSKSVKKRFDVDNGETLCKKCHKLEHKKHG
jgi:anti-repressor protein